VGALKCHSGYSRPSQILFAEAQIAAAKLTAEVIAPLVSVGPTHYEMPVYGSRLGNPNFVL
jgi:hypothetical protein